MGPTVVVISSDDDSTMTTWHFETGEGDDRWGGGAGHASWSVGSMRSSHCGGRYVSGHTNEDDDGAVAATKA